MIPDIVQQINDNISEVMNTIHTVLPGKIVSYDSAKGTATVLPIAKYKMPNGEKIDYPQLTEVPVWVHQCYGQKATVATPIKKDDECIILVIEVSPDLWLQGFETDTDLKYDLSNAVCIPGLFAKPNTVTARACDNNAVIVEVDGTYIEVQKSDIYIKGNVHIEGDLTTTGGTVNLN